MASKVDICNLALSHFGQDANISSIDPPDSSVEAEQCARFYPIALTEMLEAHPWTWAKRRATLAPLTNTRASWGFRYAMPADCVLPRSLATVDGMERLVGVTPFEREGNDLYTNVPSAELIYTFRQTDTTKYSGLFVTALSLRLASYIAGPILKDPSGQIQDRLYRRSEMKLNEAKVSDANSERDQPTYRSTAERAHGFAEVPDHVERP